MMRKLTLLSPSPKTILFPSGLLKRTCMLTRANNTQLYSRFSTIHNSNRHFLNQKILLLSLKNFMQHDNYSHENKVSNTQTILRQSSISNRILTSIHKYRYFHGHSDNKDNHSQHHHHNHHGNKSKKKWDFKLLFKQYGPVAFITYHMISTTSICLWFATVHYGADTDKLTLKLKEWMNVILILLGKKNQEQVSDNNSIPNDNDDKASRYTVINNSENQNLESKDKSQNYIQNDIYEYPDDIKMKHKGIDFFSNEHKTGPSKNVYDWQAFTTELLVAFTFHKLLLPFRLGLTALGTPRMSRFINRKGWDFWNKKKVKHI